jgi:hypothetical protein
MSDNKGNFNLFTVTKYYSLKEGSTDKGHESAFSAVKDIKTLSRKKNILVPFFQPL